MDEQEQKLMAEHGITAENKAIFHYGGHRYERLADAVNFAIAQEALPKSKAKALGSGNDVD
jgi:hypothetical protein